MAGIFKKQNNKAFNLVSEVVFEGALLSDTRAVLVTELIHYILYERQQIPLPVDQLKLRTYASNSNSDCGGAQMNSKRHPAQNVVDRKAKVFLEDLGKMCENLKNSFRSCPEIDQVAILLGGTIVSPKESYVVKLPPPCPDADCLSLKSCKNTLFKQIISEDILGSLSSSLSPSNVMVLLSAPRSCPLSWFLPKHNVSSQSGNIISFNFRCVYFVPICYDLSITECDISNISGLEPHECTLCGVVDESQSSSFNCCDSETDKVRGKDTASCVPLNCQRKSGDHLPGVPFISQKAAEVKDSAANTSKKLERFCEHKRLNYIFSARKEKNNSSVSGCSPRTPDENSNDSMELCYTPSDKVYRDLVAEVKDSAANTSKKLERFCEHKRLNYIFSARKEKNNSSVSGCSPRTPDENSNDSMELCYTPSDKVYRDLVDSTSYERKLCDYIWYQSPVILKGFKDHITKEH